MNKIGSRIDFLLESCYSQCFVCGEPFEEPPELNRSGYLEGRALIFDVVIDSYGSKEETAERICRKCWPTSLKQFRTLD
jgi:DNA primase catalytic subunit